ncbi:MAG: DUF502 domain-containing protein [Chloroflexi bacterium]|nr:DUF502 domain-containing protein [Chloroflexota bacterium]
MESPKDPAPRPNALARLRRKIGAHLRRTLIAGTLLLVPVALTYLILRFIFDLVDGVLQPFIEQVFDRRLAGLGLALAVVLVYLAGFVGANVLGRRAVGWGQTALRHIPIVGAVYGSAKTLIESFSGAGNTGFKRVVMIEYPRAGAWTIAFLTSITSDSTGRKLAAVYVPTAPTPQTGWVAILPLEDVYETDLTIPQAMQFVFSGGIITPSRIAMRKIDPSSTEGGPSS